MEVEGLEASGASYSFKVPVNSHKGKELYCISDINYENLKLKIKKSFENKIEREKENLTIWASFKKYVGVS